MVKVNTTIRLDSDIKKKAMYIANELGANLSTIISMYLKNDFIPRQRIDFKLRDEYGFTKEARDKLEKDIYEAEKGIDMSKPYIDVEELISDLRNNTVKY